VRLTMRACFVVTVLLTALATHAATVELSGVKLEDSVDAQGTKLQLNGAGIRYKAIFKVYTAGLYLTKKSATLDEVIAAPGPKRMSITMLRDIDSTELGKLFTRGVEDNMDRTEFSKIVPSIIRMGEMFASHKKLMAGDGFVVDWIPGTGTVITVKGVQQGEPFKEPKFFGALMGIWLGKSPADFKLKEALLGQKP
jgi:Chalcone isomerase-like